MRSLIVACFAALLVVPLHAKGLTTRIVITDNTSGAKSEITDRSLLDQFNVWAGRGTYVTRQGQRTEGTNGFIIDWPAGIAESRPANLRRYEVRFYVADRRTSVEKLAYVVFYEHDKASGKGYVYLPGRSDEHFGLNVGSIHRRVEGNWLHASGAWLRAVHQIVLT
jgi:hypothetical protein